MKEIIDDNGNVNYKIDFSTIEQERLVMLSENKENMNMDDAELKIQFGKESIGNHEALDRSYMIHNMWKEFVRNHPSVLMNEKQFALATVISDFMGRLYANIGSNN